MKNIKKICFLLAVALVTVTLTAEATKWKRGPSGEMVPVGESAQPGSATGSGGKPNAAAVARTRKQIQMLDDLYKTAVVLITEHYVNDPSTLSAATASKALFAAMKEKGWHDARLLGFTDVLFNPSENAPRDDFEKTAETKLLEGAATYEEVVKIEGRDHLRMATSVPVVMEKCVMCHANFKDKKGAIGAISYTVPLIQ
ncbi:MAG: c-type heme family protein [Gammaproteobacteria bacterium]